MFCALTNGGFVLLGAYRVDKGRATCRVLCVDKWMVCFAPCLSRNGGLHAVFSVFTHVGFVLRICRKAHAFRQMEGYMRCFVCQQTESYMPYSLC